MWILFILAAASVTLGFRASDRLRTAGGPRPEGLIFVLSVAIVGLIGLGFLTLSGAIAVSNNSYITADQVTARPLFNINPAFITGLFLWILAVAVYVLSALRGVAKLPAWIADLLVLVSAGLAIHAAPGLILEISSSSAPDSPILDLGFFATILTIIWIWIVARLCAGLSRVSPVAGGYLALVAGLILLLLGAAGTAQNTFSAPACAAIAGAGLATFLLSLKAPRFQLGWSSTLAVGFVLGLCSSIGLLKTTLPAILALAILALGLPLLDVTFVSVRARLRGQSVEWSSGRNRLHETLAARGVPPRKIALLYFCIGLWSCSLAFFIARWFENGTSHPLLAILNWLVLIGMLVGGTIGFFSVARILMRRAPGEIMPESIEAFGVRISPVSMEEALDKIEEFIASKCPHHVLTSDANAILTSKNDEEYAGIMRRAALITPDGFGVIWGARLLNLPIYERVTGVDMVTGICERAAKKGYRIYILGSEENVAATAARNLMQTYPGLQVVGTHHGFWRRDGKAEGLSVEAADEKMANEICAHDVDVLFVAMGIPMQEKFIAAQLERMKTPVALGVGGSFDVYAGKFNRAPQYVQRLGLEWLYRVWIDPSRWKRMGYVPKFMAVALKTWLFGPRNSRKSAPDVF